MSIFITLTDGYGYDSAQTSSCDPRTTRRARARLISSIPCDLSQQAYCNLPGSLYPWHAVRRFVRENQGLMKRMYGDLRHISVLKTEIDSNRIEMDDIQEAAERYSRRAQRKSKLLRNEFQQQQHHQQHRINDVISEPHFRPTSTSTTTSTTKTEIPTTTATTSITLEQKDDNTLRGQIERDEVTRLEEIINASIEANSVLLNFTDSADIQQEQTTNVDDELAVSTTLTWTTLSSITSGNNNIKIVDPPNLSNATLNLETSTISTSLKRITPPRSVEESTVKSMPNTKTNQSFTIDTDSRDTSVVVDTTTPSAVTVVATTTSVIQLLDDRIDNDPQTPMNHQFEKFVQKDENLGEKIDDRPSPAISTPAENMEGQLFQDMEKHGHTTTTTTTVNMVRGKGINACPVKEEVVAPFWANNTRGEVLALLNLYPFEQYVHWEKCTQEEKQMYCRDGCRCEQQYSLHRLLAYDPNNDCRGIFSDWFRFPSCCVCKCYNLPGIEYRGTSRSPRSIPEPMRHPAELAEEGLRKAIYEHATEDWYRPPKDDYYFDD